MNNWYRVVMMKSSIQPFVDTPFMRLRSIKAKVHINDNFRRADRQWRRAIV